MAKTAAPGTIIVSGVGTFQNTALPDPFDARDLEYRPRLQPLPDRMDGSAGGAYVMTQDGQSCTGHALAAVINTVLAQGPHNGQPARVSPYMLYHLARRYDEFEGESDIGSSLRGAFKGWFHHGVLSQSHWPALDQQPVPDLDSDEVMAEAGRWPLGAYYRVNPYRLDDMQSAIAELNAICVSALIHQGWQEPVTVRRNGRTMHVIARPVNARALGGHAFAVVGYNEVGFLVQNSWGTGWGDTGLATLPYDDLLESVFDAWVARPGVPQTPFAGGRSQTVEGTGGRLLTGPAPDLRRLQTHVVNLGNGGRLSTAGRFISSPEQITRVFEHMDRWHEFWRNRGDTTKRHVMLYAHGGLNSEEHALGAAQENLNWWLNNGVYPIFFAWQSGVSETLMDHLVDAVKGRLPFGFGFDLVEHVDRRVELTARKLIRWMWDEMKENARAASQPFDGADETNAPGASLTVKRLGEYIARHGADNVAVHLVGHSAGSVFHAAMLRRLADAGIDVASMSFLAPAIRVDEFARDVLPHLGHGVRSFATFNLSDERELDDVCGAGGLNIYHKSILYLVSRAFEGDRADIDVPILGMQRFSRTDIGGRTLEKAILEGNGAVVVSRSDAPADSRSDASSHGGFAGDGPTMTSVLMRVLGLSAPTGTTSYRPNAALTHDGAPMVAARRPAATMAAARSPGHSPLVDTAETPAERPEAPAQDGVSIEVASSPESGCPVLDILVTRGWEPVS